MTLEEQLKQEIIKQHGSVSAFSKSIGLSNSTVDSILNRGIYNSGVGKVMQIFDALGIDTESISVGHIIYAGPETKKAPAPTEVNAEAQNGKLSREDVEKVLMSLGFIEAGQDITDGDLVFLESVVNILDAWFQKRSQ